jgi:hypothetical protein
MLRSGDDRDFIISLRAIRRAGKHAMATEVPTN